MPSMKKTLEATADAAVQSSWYVYLLLCADNSLYCGICTDTQRRLYEHNFDNKKAAKYTRVRRPLRLVYVESVASRSLASKREYLIKRYTRKQKIALVDNYAVKKASSCK